MRKNSFRTFVLCVAVSLAMLCASLPVVSASGSSQLNTSVAEQAAKVKIPGEEIGSVTAVDYIVTEMQTGTVLFEKNADKKTYASHFNKIMTLLLLAEKISAGKISVDSTFAATELANSQKDPQIWLDKGEKISVDELIKAITVGNANDAAVTIAENVAGSEKKFVDTMNARAKALGMSRTVYKDSTGADKSNVTTARDLSKLCAQISRYEFLKPYLKTWLVTVRNGKAELVNSNRLVRSYQGMTGVKACSSKDSGSCACVTAYKSKLQLCAVVIGCADSDKRDSDLKKLLKCSADCYQLYSPQVPDEMLENIAVTGGESLVCELELEKTPLVVIKRGSSAQLQPVQHREETIEAPVAKGQVCATYTLEYENKPVCTVNIVAKREIKKMNWLCGVKKLLYNLIKL